MTQKKQTPADGHPDANEEREPKERDPKPAHRPTPGVKHVPEPDAENIMPAEHEPGTL